MMSLLTSEVFQAVKDSVSLFCICCQNETIHEAQSLCVCVCVCFSFCVIREV